MTALTSWNTYTAPISAAIKCPECTQKRAPVFDDDGDFVIWDCSNPGKNCEIPPQQ